jgi:metal-responsive CopG/Arc/MetJ family transcriptional regulator
MKPIHIKLPEAMVAQLEAHQERLFCDRSTLIRNVLANWLNENPLPEPKGGKRDEKAKKKAR